MLETEKEACSSYSNNISVAITENNVTDWNVTDWNVTDQECN